MKEQGWFDLGRIFDEVFETAQNFKDAFREEFKDGFSPKNGPRNWGFDWDENIDFYPLYHYPPANIFLTEDRKLVFEFAFAGFNEKSISLEFQGDYMVISAEPSVRTEEGGVKYFKHRLKLKEIKNHKYYVPEKKFDREKVDAKFKDGILKVVVPPKENYSSTEGVKVEIVREAE
ncbi:MAG: Hsp20/alpha crystallin family protein [Spirochaetales bacterium]|nr:Hsp20/alpha crystallin family protein [Spirochaetales bacterium]